MDIDALTSPLYKKIGRLKMELDWLKKNLALTLEEKQGCVESDHPHLSIRRQCDLLDLNRSSFYSTPAIGTESSETLEITERIDKQYTEVPTYGSRRMTAWLRREGEIWSTDIT